MFRITRTNPRSINGDASARSKFTYRLSPEDRILYIRLSAIGDVINAIPGLVALRRSYPRNYIAWIVEELSAELLRGHPYLDDLFVVKSSWHKSPLSHLSEIRAFIHGLRMRNFTVALDVHGLLKSSVFAWLSGAPARIGQEIRNIEGHHFFLNTIIGSDGIGPSPAAVHRSVFLENLGVDLSTMEYVFPEFNEESARVDQILKDAGIGAADLTVVLNPCASRLTKQWPGEHFVTLGRHLQQKHHAKLIWTGAKNEAAYIEDLAAAMPDPSLNLAGRLNLRELAALLGKTKLMVTGDTGPMHLGAAMGTFIVALMGSTDPAIHGPYTERKLILSAELPCQYCGAWKCPTKIECLQCLVPDQAILKVDKLIATNKSILT